MFRIATRLSSTTTLPVGRYNFSEKIYKNEMLTLRIIKPDNVNIIIESCKNKDSNEVIINEVENIDKVRKADNVKKVTNIDDLTDEEFKQMINFIV